MGKAGEAVVRLGYPGRRTTQMDALNLPSLNKILLRDKIKILSTAVTRRGK